MPDRDAFRVMCDMWGVETAVKKAKEFGMRVSQEEIDAQQGAEYRKLQNARRALSDLLNKKRR